MQAKELRIGNAICIYTGNKIGECILIVEKISDSVINDYDIDYCEPIPLTEEWYLRLGLKKSPANNSYYLSVPEIKAEIHFEYFRKEYICVLYCSVGQFIPTDIQYVHQLQNLYFALTGQELTLR